MAPPTPRLRVLSGELPNGFRNLARHPLVAVGMRENMLIPVVLGQSVGIRSRHFFHGDYKQHIPAM